MDTKRLPVGTSDFKELIKGNFFFVDKSLFAKEIIDADAKVLLLPRPRRFGKTLNISMLRYYFDLNEKEQCQLFDGCNILNEKALNEEHMGKYPVVFLTFKDVKSKNWNTCFESLTEVIKELFQKHHCLFENECVPPEDKKIFEDILKSKARYTDYSISLKKITFYLEQIYNKEVILLIDEYDAPVHSGFLNGYYDEVIGFMRIFLSGGLKDNTSLYKGVVTGILRVSKESIFSGVNNLKVHSIRSKKFADKFGFTSDEVKDLVEYFGVPEQFDNIQAWYDGYLFGDERIYNPWSVINYISDYENGFQAYWGNSSSNDLILHLFKNSREGLRKDFGILLDGGVVTKELHENIVMSSLGYNTDVIFSFLYFSGYLKASRKETDNPLDKSYVFSIPNFEVTEVLHDLIKDWLQEAMGQGRLFEMLTALTSGYTDTFSSYLQEFVINMMSYQDIGKGRGQEDRPESVYQAFILGMLVILEGKYEVSSNRESGFGRYDIMVIPRDRSKLGIIMELKKVSNKYDEIPEKDLTDALAQIEDKRYEQELRRRGVSDILKLAIVFEGKSVWVRSVR